MLSDVVIIKENHEYLSLDEIKTVPNDAEYRAKRKITFDLIQQHSQRFTTEELSPKLEAETAIGRASAESPDKECFDTNWRIVCPRMRCLLVDHTSLEEKLSFFLLLLCRSTLCFIGILRKSKRKRHYFTDQH